jgi:hypothetical protein
VAYRTDTANIIEAAYPELDNAPPDVNGDYLVVNPGPDLQWFTSAEPKPSEQQVNDWGNDVTPLPSGQLYSEWLAINGGDPDATARDQAIRLYDEISTPGAGFSSVSRLDRATMRAIIDEFNRHSATDYAGLHVQAGSANSQPIPTGVETRVTLWNGEGESFKGSTSDQATGLITVGKAGHYMISLSAAYTHTGGDNCDLTWRIKADGQSTSGFASINQTVNAQPDTVGVGPYVTGFLNAGAVLEVTVEHAEATDKNLIIQYAQFQAIRQPSINDRTFDQLRTVLLAKLNEE